MQNSDRSSFAVDPELVSRLVASYGLEAALAERIVEDIMVTFSSTPEEWVRSRHIRLQPLGLKNDEIYRSIIDELPSRRFASPPLTERQIRRLIYG